MFRHWNPGLAGLDGYCKSTGESFCPYILPALQRRCVLFSVYKLEDMDLERLSETIFYLGLIHTELLRVARRKTTDDTASELLCENIIAMIPNSVLESNRNILSWPHWLLKLLYTRFRLMFGKFKPEGVELARSGIPLPAPPYLLLSIRSAIPSRDATFFTKAPRLSPILSSSSDSGELPIATAIHHDLGNALNFLKNLSPQTVTYQEIWTVVSSLQSSRIYHQIKEWSCGEEARLGLSI